MCAIIGWKGNITPSLLREQFRRAEPSGPMSTGLMTIDNVGKRGHEYSLDLWKKAITASVALRNHNHRLDRMSTHSMGIGHTRYATHGRICDENAHPFSDHGVHFVHNGVISNYRQIKPDAIVDSQCLGPLIRQRDISPAWGSVGLVWFEKVDSVWKMFVYRHQQSLMVAKAAIHVNGMIHHVMLVGSRQQHFPSKSVSNMEFMTLTEGVAYEVTDTGVIEAWRNPSQAQTFVRETHRNGCYIGG